MKNMVILMIVFLISFSGFSLPIEQKPKNVIMVLIDDMGYGDIAPHGNPILKTPNFDKLHEVSVRFTNLIRHEPCEDTECRTCVTARRRGIEKKRPLYISYSEHYVLTSPGKWELYNIKSDPHQNKNIAAENPQIVKKNEH